MAFVNLKPRSSAGNGASRRKTETVSVALKKGVARIAVSSDVYKRIHEPTYFKIKVGTKEDLGKIMLVPTRQKSSSSYKIGRQPDTIDGQVWINVSAHRLGVDAEDHPVLPQDFQVVDGAILVDMSDITSTR